MGDFFTPPIGSPLPPEEPDTPVPNFTQFGSNFGLGLQQTGVLSSIWNGFKEAFLAAATLVLGFLMKSIVQIFTYFVTLLGNAETDAQASYGGLVAATFQNLFGVTVNPADVSSRQGGAGRQAAADALAQALIGKMFAGATPAAGGGVTPSAAAADSYLAVGTNMEINGWIEGWLTDGLSGHLLERYGDLKDGLARVLGMGRLTRQVLRAPVKILVSDPYDQLLQSTYRAKVWQPEHLIRQLNRGDIQRADLSGPLGIQGYTEAQIDELVLDQQKWLSLADLDYLNSRGVWTDDAVTQYLTAFGYTSDYAAIVLEVMKDKRVQPYRQQMVKVGEDAYVAGNIGPDTFSTILQNAGITQDEQTWITNLADLKIQVKVRHLTEAEIMKGIDDGVLNFNDLKTWALREGVSDSDEAILELEEQFNLNKQAAAAKAKAAAAAAKIATANAKVQAAQQKAAKAQTLANDAGLSAATAATLVEDGLWTIAQYQAFLAAKGYGPDAVTASTELLQAKLNATAAKTSTAAALKAAPKAKALNLAQAEKSVLDGLWTSDQLQAWLTSNGYDAGDAQVIVDQVNDQVQSAQTKAAAKAAATAKAAEKSISLADLERAVRLGLTPQATYDAALQTAGFDAASIALLDGLLQAQIASDKATAAKSAAAAALPGTKGVTVAQIEQEVLAGVRPIADYTAELQALKYSTTDQQQLTALLQMKLDQAQATAAKKAAAAAALANRGISLADAERAVKLGVVPMSTYTALLQSLHYTPDAIDVLTNSLTAQLAATKKTQAAATAAGTALATKAISLSDLEKAVIAGIQPISAYTSTLTANGYSAADAATLTQLLQLKVDQAARAAAAHADAEGQATQKGISLASEEAAVVAGNLTMDDYDALLTSLGYDDIDRATLEQLLQAKITAAAAKAGTAAPASSTTGTPPATT